MYKKNYYEDLSEVEIQKKVEDEGFDPIKISNVPGFVYQKHTHPETKLLVFLSGNMLVKTGGKKINCGKGDKLVITGNQEHSAVIGSKGCTFFWSEKII